MNSTNYKIIKYVLAITILPVLISCKSEENTGDRKDQSQFKGKFSQGAAFVHTPYYEFDVPAQDKGLPYTRSSAEFADKTLQNYIALHELGRNVYFYGKKSRIDNVDILRGEPINDDGDIYVPLEFFKVLLLDRNAEIPQAPEYINKNVWIYTLPTQNITLPANLKTKKFNNRDYIELEYAIKKANLKYKKERGLYLIADKKQNFPKLSKVEMDNLITRFDTPEKYIDPDLATNYIPVLKAQGKWTTHVKLEKGDIEMLGGAEVEFPVTPKSEFNYDGFNSALLGSKVPAPGVWPRLFFSPEDIPKMRETLKTNKQQQKSLAEIEYLLNKSFLNPQTDDGKIFEKLVNNDVADLKWQVYKTNNTIQQGLPSLFEGQKPTIYSSHITYNATALTTLAMYALYTGNDELAQKVATATYNYYKLIEPQLDEYLKNSDSEFGFNFDTANGSTTQWRGRHGVTPHMDYFFALDLNGRFMTKEQQDFMVKYISKLTYGVRTSGGDGPRRNWRDINHVTWHLTHLLGLMTIEGLEGCDQEALASGKELVGDFVEWGINKHGTTFESNGKSGGGIVFQLLSMAALARRGENFFGHPHFRQFFTAQVQNMAPASLNAVSSGSWSGSPLEFNSVMSIKSFLPNDLAGDFILSRYFPTLDLEKFDIEEYKKDLQKNEKNKYGRLRMPSPSYPAFVMPLIFDGNWKNLKDREELKLPLDFVDEETGILSSYSSNKSDATWFHFMVRNNHYMGSGHHHADAGMFHFSSDKVDWIKESPFQMYYNGAFHNQVLVDGKAAPDSPMARPDLLKITGGEKLSTAVADLTNSYSYGWSCQFMLFDGNSNWMANDDKKWTLARDPYQLKFYKGTERYKMRPWWATGVFSNWFPNFQYEYNKMDYVFRSVAFVRGENKSFAVIADDLKKDDQKHLYQWTGYLGNKVWRIREDSLPKNMILLGVDSDPKVKTHHAGESFLRHYKKGEPTLLVVTLEPEDSNSGKLPLMEVVTVEGQKPPVSRSHWDTQKFCDRVQINREAVEGKFRVLLIPHTYGADLPVIQYDGNIATVKFGSQVNTIVFDYQNGSKYTTISNK